MSGVITATPLTSGRALRRWMPGLTLAMLFAGWGDCAFSEPVRTGVWLTDPESGEQRYLATAIVPKDGRVDASHGRTIVNVAFFADERLIAQATTVPYAFGWTDVPAGQYRLQARATDDNGESIWSPPVLVQVQENREPQVRLVSPRPHERFAASATVELEASARDRDGNIARVEFYADGTLLGVSEASPYRFSWQPARAGRYMLGAKAVDALGAIGTSRLVPIEVAGNLVPTASLVSPEHGAAFTAPADITLTAEAADSDGAVARVEFYNGASLIAAVTSPPYSIVWTGVPVGAYTLTAVVTDDQNASATSAAVNVTVNAGVAQVYFIHTDHLNTPRVITNAAAQVVWRWDQTDPFGGNPPDENPSGLGTFTCNLRFPGQYFDKETNTHYNYFRDYDPRIGRYIQSDPIGLYGGLNTYVYAFDPLIQVDPFGLMGRGPAGNNKGGPSARIRDRADCGPQGGFFNAFIPDNPLGFPFLQCCDAHDKCYDNCLGPDKLGCDMQGCACFFGTCKPYSAYVQTACQWAAQQYCYQITYSSTADRQFWSARANCKGDSCNRK
jgi:RHS repeat-associated protein